MFSTPSPISVMAHSGIEANLFDFMLPGQAATPTIHCNTENDILCDDMYRAITSKIGKCKYFDVNATNFPQSNNYSLKLMHLNIRSLPKNYDALCNLLQSLKFFPDLFCLTETRIKDRPLFNISLPGYSFVHVNSKTAAGGVAVYISNRLNYKFYEKQFRLHKAESIWLNISGCHQNCIVGVIYRHPSLTKINKFLNDLSSCLFELSSCNKSFYLLGDVNINIDQNNRITIPRQSIISMFYFVTGLSLLSQYLLELRQLLPP